MRIGEILGLTCDYVHVEEELVTLITVLARAILQMAQLFRGNVKTELD